MNTKRKITLNSIRAMGGICFILFGLVILFSEKTPFKFLVESISHFFGFIGFWILVPYIIMIGIYFIMHKQLMKLRFDISLWGFFIMIVCFSILSSHWATVGLQFEGVELTGNGFTSDGDAKYLIFSNATKIFDILSKEEANAIGPNPKLGGGLFGFIVAGSLNSAITPLGLNIVCWILFISGLLMLLNKEVNKIYLFFANKPHYEKKQKKTKNQESENLTITTDDSDSSFDKVIPNNSYVQTTSEDTSIVNKPTYEPFGNARSINNDYSLKKAHLSFGDTKNETFNKNQKIEFESPAVPAQFAFKDEVVEEPKVQEIVEKVPETFDEFVNQTAEQLKENIEKEDINEQISNLQNSFEISNDEDVQCQPFEENKIEEQKPEEEIDPLFRPQPKAHLMKDYIYPTLDLLDLHENMDDAQQNEESCEGITNIINETLSEFNIGAQVVGHTIGPAVTRYDVAYNKAVSSTVMQKYITDISRKLNGESVRFEPIVTGKSTSGLEITNKVRTTVGLKESISALPSGEKNTLQIPFGRSISNDLVYANLAEFPHLLVSGTTGSGKSIFIHAAIITLLLRNTPDELKLMMIDPKKVEMNYYKDIPHLICPIISDPLKANIGLQKLVDEMERRFNLFQANNVTNIKGFNAYAKEHELQPLPYIAIFIDEYADLMDTCKDVRDSVVRIAQKARAAGIHLIIATQRPSVNVIDGVIKANVSTRVALMSASYVDSNTIINEGGAEKLLGNGDMLVDCSLISRTSKPRVQGCFVSESEIIRVCDFLRNHYQTQYDPSFLNLEPKPEKTQVGAEIKAIDKNATEEAQYQSIKEQIMHQEYCSISFIQRSFAMGFPRAGRIFNRLIKEGIVEPDSHGNSRGSKVLTYQPGQQQMGTIEQSTFIPDDDNYNN